MKVSYCGERGKKEQKYYEVIKSNFRVSLKTLKEQLFLKLSGKLFHILAPAYCNEHLKQRLSALGINNLLV